MQKQKKNASRNSKKSNMPKKDNIFRSCLNVIVNGYYRLSSALDGSTYYVGTLLIVAAPFVMTYVGEYAYSDRGYWAVGGEWILPAVFLIVGSFLRSLAKERGTDRDLPVPYDRFTDPQDDGEVFVDQDRLQEMILYMADLEDWFEREGYTRR